ncbi:MAG: hypothetical protein ACK5QT_06685 [Oligoflexia bacterium]
MKTEDLRSLSQIGNALWLDRDLSRRRTAETLEAVSLLALPEDALLERASSALLARASREDLGSQAAFLGDPFFRLLPEERFLLVALHVERWSYEKVARILKSSPEQVATRAWKIRVHLASQGAVKSRPKSLGRTPGGAPVLGAVGVAARGPSCPEFHALHPWTQRFLDEEYGSRERIFLQNHLMACDHCRAALNRCRELYYEVEKRIPRVDHQAFDEFEEWSQIIRSIRRHQNPMLWTWRDALAAYLRRPEAQFFISLVIVYFVWRLGS